MEQYFYEDEFISKEEYLKRIKLEGYEDYYEEIIKKTSGKHTFDSLYLIQLFDYNCPSCVSGVTKVFVDDIEDFTEKYTSIETDKERIERFLRSKSGEIVTDYYSDDTSLNIVQKLEIEDLGWVIGWNKDCIKSIANGCGWESDYWFGFLSYEIKWIKYNDKYYKLVKTYGRDCCKKYDLDMANPWRRIEIEGNPFWIVNGNENKPYAAKSRKEFCGTSIDSYVWQVAAIFDNEEGYKADLNSKELLSSKQISKVFADIPGDAG